jgi:hypothetical protein
LLKKSKRSFFLKASLSSTITNEKTLCARILFVNKQVRHPGAQYIDTMNGLLNLLILYIIFMVFSSLFKKVQSKQASPQKQKTPSQRPKTLAEQSITQPKDLQQKYGRYNEKLEKYLDRQKGVQQQPERLAPKEERSPLLEIEPQPEELLLASNDVELEHLLNGSPQQILQKKIARSSLHHRIPSTTHARPIPSLLSFEKRRGYIQGIILSEILGPPVSKRPRKFKH